MSYTKSKNMSYKNVLLAFISVMAIVSSTVRAQDQVVVESTSETPLAYDVDVVVYGATSGGISAAAAAAREGKSVLLVEHLPFLGGLLGGGFNMHQDVPFREPLGGITLWWYDRVSKYAGKHNRVMENRALAREMLSPYADKIQILTEYRVRSVTMDGDRIVSILLENAETDEFGIPAPEPTSDKTVVAKGRVFIDSSYEGDVMAMANVSYTVGRESAAQYGETMAGVFGIHRFPGISPYKIENDPSSGLLPFIDPKPLGKEGDASDYVQGYNFKLFWNKTGGGRPMLPPDTTAPNYAPVNELYGRMEAAGYRTSWPHHNDERRQVFTGTIPGIQGDYPDGDWAQRSAIWRDHIEHARRLTALKGIKMNLDDDHAPDTKGWPGQLYLRTTRRLVGEYVLTQKDIQLQTEIPDSIGLGFYAIDTHIARLLVLDDGTLASEGDITILVSPGPWGLPYRFITPKREECTNLLVPVCFSASHIAHGATRLEAQYMIIGESAGVAAAQAFDNDKDVQAIDVKQLQKRLVEHGQELEWDGEGYGRYRSCVRNNNNFHPHILNRWQNHPEEYPKSMPKPRHDVPILMDDIHAQRVGDWEESSKYGFCVNQGTLNDKGTGKGEKSVIFKPIIRRGGLYEVKIAWPRSPENTKHAPILIRHADGQDTVLLDQTQKKIKGFQNKFLSIGTYRFEADGQSTVTFQTQGTEDGLVMVDGVQFVPAWGEEAGTKRAKKAKKTEIAEKPKAEKPVKGSAQTSENKPWIKAFFEKNPAADTNEDGILTLEEVSRFKESRKTNP